LHSSGDRVVGLTGVVETLAAVGRAVVAGTVRRAVGLHADDVVPVGLAWGEAPTKRVGVAHDNGTAESLDSGGEAGASQIGADHLPNDTHQVHDGAAFLGERDFDRVVVALR